MPQDALEQRLVEYLTDVHSTERNALSSLRAGAGSVDDQDLAAAFRDHFAATEEHERLIGERLAAHEAGPSTLRDAAPGDHETVQVAGRILKEEHAAAERLSNLLERIADDDRHQMGLAA